MYGKYWGYTQNRCTVIFILRAIDIFEEDKIRDSQYGVLECIELSSLTSEDQERIVLAAVRAKYISGNEEYNNEIEYADELHQNEEHIYKYYYVYMLIIYNTTR